ALALGAIMLTARNPEPIPFYPPELRSLVGWTAALIAALVILLVIKRHAPATAVGVTVLELFLAAHALPYNRLTPPDTFNEQRFTVSQMQVYAERETPPGRLLSITDLLFDPGDKATLIARYQRLGMSEEEIEIALVAIKHQEVLAANLPLYWGIPTIDGFDGGVLPTGYYTAFTSLLLPPGELRTIDGRLREVLARADCDGACIPDRRWLDLTNVRYLLLDKIYDVWHEDVAYDTAFSTRLAADQRLTLTPEPAFDADALYLLCPESATCTPNVTFIYEDGNQTTLAATTNEILGSDHLAKFRADSANTVIAIEIEGANPQIIRAATLIDERSGDFQQLTVAPWSRVLSSDIKLYENGAVLPRAFVLYDSLPLIDDIYGTEDALNIMRRADFDPAQTAMIMGLPPEAATTSDDGFRPASIREYTPERVVVDVESAYPGYLLLTDAYYPGWRATVNTESVPIYRADVMFRAVAIPAGKSEVVFEYHPDWLDWLPLAGLPWLLLTIFTITSLRPRGN
ncbi:MAG: YfhO family protein, partial [Anaerolineae bacterium]|nr:YfhO family protein [Anaerolineae bacterium]